MAIRQGVHTHIALGIFLICSGGLCGITLVGLPARAGAFLAFWHLLHCSWTQQFYLSANRISAARLLITNLLAQLVKFIHISLIFRAG